MSLEDLKVFDTKPIRCYWDEDKDEWFFCLVDVVEALSQMYEFGGSSEDYSINLTRNMRDRVASHSYEINGT